MMTNVNRENFAPADGVECRPVFISAEGLIMQKLELHDFVYIRSNIPGPGCNLEHFEENIMGCECSLSDEENICDDDCSCIKLFGNSYYGRKLVIKNSLRNDRKNDHAEDNSAIEFNRPILECGANCSCLCRDRVRDKVPCANSVVGAGITFPFIIFYDNKKGFGLKCLETIPKGSYVCEYAGEVIGEEEARKRIKQKKEKSINQRLGKFTKSQRCEKSMNYIIVLSEEVVANGVMTADGGNADREPKMRKTTLSRRTIVDAEKYSNVGHFINHSCHPNLVRE